MPEEQLTEEELNNMAPEQIHELQKKQCIFCHIVSGRVASRRVYEDEKSLAILDINPSNPGHILLMPKEHYSIMPQVPEEITGHLFVVAKHISHALLKALKVGGTYIFAANGVAAGQKAAHFMIHIIPRKEGDGLALDIPEKVIKEDQLEQLKDVLVGAIEKSIDSQIKIEEEPKAMKIEMEKPVEIKKPKGEIVEEEFEEHPDLDAISALVSSNITEKEEPEEIFEEKFEEKYISSVNSEKFHALNCPFAKNIKQENRIYFKTKKQAKKEKIACGCVE